MEKSIVTIIKELCEERSISIGDLEKSLGFSQGLISRWDKNSPSIDKILSVSDYFQVSTDYLLGKTKAKQSLKLEDSFLEKLLMETENYNLNWKKYSEQFISFKHLKDAFCSLYGLSHHKVVGDIESVYELEYNASCIYIVCADYDFKFSVFVMMQLNKNIDSCSDNFVPISDYQDFDKAKILEHNISMYLKTFKIKEKSRVIMRNFINNVASSEFPDEPIPYSHISNNCLTTEPGFVLDARQGKMIFDEILKIWAAIPPISK